MTTPGQYIKYCREYHGLTQLQLSKEIGVTQQLVSAWESNRTLVTDNHAENLVTAIGIDKSVLKDLNKAFEIAKIEARP